MSSYVALQGFSGWPQSHLLAEAALVLQLDQPFRGKVPRMLRAAGPTPAPLGIDWPPHPSQPGPGCLCAPLLAILCIPTLE
jgi:hypothetical protein